MPILGLGTVELDSVPYRNVTEKDFTSHDTSAWLGSGTSGTVFKMNFMGKRQVAVKQIPKSDDTDEIKVNGLSHAFEFTVDSSGCGWISGS